MSKVDFLRKTARYVVVVEYTGKMPNVYEQKQIIKAFANLCPDGLKSYPDMTIFNEDDITKIVVKHVVDNNGQNGQPSMVVSPEEAAAKVIGEVFEDKLKTGNAAVITLALNAQLVKHLNSDADVSKALRNAFIVLSRDNVFIKIPLELRERYNITKEVLNIIRDLAKIHQLR